MRGNPGDQVRVGFRQAASEMTQMVASGRLYRGHTQHGWRQKHRGSYWINWEWTESGTKRWLGDQYLGQIRNRARSCVLRDVLMEKIIWLKILGTRVRGEGEREASKEKCLMGLADVKVLSGLDVCLGSMVCPEDERLLLSLNQHLHSSTFYSEQFPEPNIIFGINSKKCRCMDGAFGLE